MDSEIFIFRSMPALLWMLFYHSTRDNWLIVDMDINTPRQKKTTIFNNGRHTSNIPTNSHTITTTDIKTNMRHIHTSIVSMHLATRGNDTILRTPPPHISSSEKILPRLTRRTLAQLRTNKSTFLKSYYTKSTPNHIHHHYAPSVTLTHTTHITSSTATTYAPRCHPWIYGHTPPV